jgi:hypothetical protein
MHVPVAQCYRDPVSVPHDQPEDVAGLLEPGELARIRHCTAKYQRQVFARQHNLRTGKESRKVHDAFFRNNPENYGLNYAPAESNGGASGKRRARMSHRWLAEEAAVFAIELAGALKPVDAG